MLPLNISWRKKEVIAKSFRDAGVFGEEREKVCREHACGQAVQENEPNGPVDMNSAQRGSQASVKNSMHFKVCIRLQKTPMIFVSAFILSTPQYSAAHFQLFYPAAGETCWEEGGEGQEGETKGSAGRSSVIWERVNFRSAKSGHKATAAKPQRSTYSFPGSIASQPQICAREPSMGEPSSSPISAFSQRQDGKGFTRQHY